MSMFAKIMVIVNLILAVVFLAAAGTLHGATESWKLKHTTVEKKAMEDAAIAAKNIQDRDATNKGQADNIAVLRGRAEAAEAVQKGLVDSNSTLSAANTAKQNTIDQQSTNINELTKTVADLTSRNSTLSNNLATSEAEKKQAMDDAASTRESLARETARAENAEKSVASAEMKNKDLTDNLDRVTTELTGYKSKYPSIGNGTMKPVNGVVSAADSKADVYVLSVGSKDGVEIGYEFVVYRGGSYIATIVVDSVQGNLSSARVKPGSKKSDVQAGDSAATRL